MAEPTLPLQPAGVIPAVRLVDPTQPAGGVSQSLSGHPDWSALYGRDRVELSPLGWALARYDWRRQEDKPGLEAAVREWAANQACEPREGSAKLYPKGAGVRTPAGQAARHTPGLECAQRAEGRAETRVGAEDESPVRPAYRERLAAAEAAALGLRLRLELPYGTGQETRPEPSQYIDFWV